jgi:signal transduction histidine kinase
MEKKLRILILEDVEEDAVLIDWALKKEKIAYSRLRVDTQIEFIAALDDFNPDIILSDHSLPQFNSTEALKICKQKKNNVPFILVTGAVSEEFAVNSLKQGANDYILKSNLSRLPAAIEQALRQHQYEGERKKNEEMLRQQNEELTKINKELDSFVYSISHNLRSPLSTVLGLVNIAKLEPEVNPEKVNQYFNMIEASILKLDRTLREILDYSQNARTDLEIVEVNLDNLIEESFEQLKYLPGYADVAKTVDIQRSDKPFYSDPHRLSIVFNNLIANCICYRDGSKSNPSIKIVAKIDNDVATFTIQDNGIGIGQEYLPLVFDMFFRATERSEGAGLGLYIVKEMIGKLKGTISVNSTALEGTLVTFSIPNKSQSPYTTNQDIPESW